MAEGTVPRAGDLRVSVVYASDTQVFRVTLSLPQKSTVLMALEHSGLLQQHPALSASPLHVGIYGSRVSLDAVLRMNDRVEIYRPLTVDPKEARRRKAAKRRLDPRSLPARCPPR